MRKSISKILDRPAWEPLLPQEIEAVAVVIARQEQDELARELGRFLMVWGHLEMGVTILLSRIATGTDALEFSALTNGADVYRKAEALHFLAKVRHPKADWLPCLEKFAGAVLGPLREKRNQLVHDHWLHEDGTISQINLKLRPKGSNGSPSLADEKNVTPAEVRTTYVEVFRWFAMLKPLDARISAEGRAKGTQPV